MTCDTWIFQICKISAFWLIFWVYIISTDPGIYHSPPPWSIDPSPSKEAASAAKAKKDESDQVRKALKGSNLRHQVASGRQVRFVGGSILSSLASPGRIGLWDSFLTWPFHGFSINGCWILNSYIQLGAHRPAVNYPVTPLKFNIAPEKWWLEAYFPIGKVTFQGAMLNFGRVNFEYPSSWPLCSKLF